MPSSPASSASSRRRLVRGSLSSVPLHAQVAAVKAGARGAAGRLGVIMPRGMAETPVQPSPTTQVASSDRASAVDASPPRATRALLGRRRPLGDTVGSRDIQTVVRPAWTPDRIVPFLGPHSTPIHARPRPRPGAQTEPSTPRPRWRPTAVKPRTIEEAGVRTTPCLDHRGHGGTGSLGQTFTSFHEGTTDAHQDRLPRIPSFYWLHTLVRLGARLGPLTT